MRAVALLTVAALIGCTDPVAVDNAKKTRANADASAKELAEVKSRLAKAERELAAAKKPPAKDLAAAVPAPTEIVASGPASVSSADFMDNMSKYAGKEVEFYGFFETRGAYSIREGHYFEFWLDAARHKAKGFVWIDLKGLADRPAIKSGERVILRFKSTNGDVARGNIAVSLRRPDDNDYAPKDRR